jgi:fumarate reductase subunit C
MYYFLRAQTLHARTSTTSHSALSIHDVLGKFPLLSGYEHMFALAQVIVLYNIIFAIVTILRMFLYYLEFENNPAVAVIRIIYAGFLMLHVFSLFILSGVVGAWMILASILNPTRFLPYGTAVVVVVLVVRAVYAEMNLVAEEFKKVYRKVFDSKLAAALASAREDANQQDGGEGSISTPSGVRQRCSRTDASDGVDEAVDENSEEVPSQPAEVIATGKRPSPAELFNIIDVDGNGTIEVGEFQSYLEKLNLGLSKNQIAQFIAYCDSADGDKKITKIELEESWDFLMQNLEEAAAQNCGVSTTDIIFGCLTITAAIGLLFAFIFLALQGWYNASSFDSMIQSLMVSGSGGVMKRLRSKAAAEGDENAVMAKVSELTGQEEDDDGD